MNAPIKTDVGLTTALRAPVQGRSKASYERMVAAAEALMVSRGSDDFTLIEVSKQGKVSIGSIYNRFESKDALLHAVQYRVLEQLDAKMHQQIGAARAQATDLTSLVIGLVRAEAETLNEFADRMRPLMQRASADPIVAKTGKHSYADNAKAVKDAMLAYRGEIRQPDPDRAVDSAFRIMYASIARYLGFGSSTTAAWEGDWNVLTQDLARMLAAFLTNAPPF